MNNENIKINWDAVMNGSSEVFAEIPETEGKTKNTADADMPDKIEFLIGSSSLMILMKYGHDTADFLNEYFGDCSKTIINLINSLRDQLEDHPEGLFVLDELSYVMRAKMLSLVLYTVASIGIKDADEDAKVQEEVKAIQRDNDGEESVKILTNKIKEFSKNLTPTGDFMKLLVGYCTREVHSRIEESKVNITKYKGSNSIDDLMKAIINNVENMVLIDFNRDLLSAVHGGSL